jgi:hypothetical protein
MTGASLLRPMGVAALAVAAALGSDPAAAAEPVPLGPPGTWRLVWADEFAGPAGARPAPHWFFFDGWGKTRWRDAWYTTEDAFLNGMGQLVLRSRVDPTDGNKPRTSYLQTYDWKVPKERWTTFGPGDGTYIEARVDLTGLEARAQWAAIWLFDPSDTYDGDPANGTEIDIMEYLVADGLRNTFNVANHWGPDGAKWGHEGRETAASRFGADLRDGRFHTFGLEWQRDRLTYFFDGQPVWSTTAGVSTSDGQALMLSIEIDDGPGNAWGRDDVFANDAALLPDAFVVDYVRVFARTP